MTEHYQNLRSQLTGRFIDYLQTDHVCYWPPALTICPQCHKNCPILCDTQWHCKACKLRGDVVDYVMINNAFPTPEAAIRHLCRMLGIKNTRLEVISAEGIMDAEYPELAYVADGFLPKGLSILAGPAKIGKSWLVLWLAHCVSTGQPVWSFPSHQSQVLYLCLEDPLRRLQTRLVDVTDGQTGQIWFANEAELIGNGLEEQLIGFLRENPETKLVIIDTLEKIREMRGERCSYAGDYRAMSTLKAIADRFDAAILLIHHTRKTEARDPFDMILGSRGLSGCVDGSYVLLPGLEAPGSAVLTAKGRDVEEMKLTLRFSRESRLWELLGTNQEERPLSKHEKVLLKVRDFMGSREEWTGTASELLEALTAGDGSVSLTANVLMRILNANQIMLRDLFYVSFRPHRTKTAKLLSLEKLPEPEESAEQEDDEEALDEDDTAPEDDR